MYSFEPGVYSAEGQPDIIVTYGGEIADDPDHTGPWVQWCFPHEEASGEWISTVVFLFRDMVETAGYKLREARPSLGFRSK